MGTPPAPHRSFVLRCALVLLLAATPVACKSSRDAARVTPTTTTTTSTTTTSTTTTTTLAPTTTTEPPYTAGGVLRVANASGVDGAASVLSADLAALGFVLRDPVNAFGVDADLATSKIYIVAGAELVAASVSRMMGGIPVYVMPTPVWIVGGGSALGDTNVLIMLGHDLAGKHLAEMIPVATTTTAAPTTTQAPTTTNTLPIPTF